MVLDSTPLTTHHATIFFLTFGTVFGALYLIVRVLPLLEPKSNRKSVYYAGNVLVVGITIIASLYITDDILRLGLLASAALALVVGTMDEIYKIHPALQLLAQTCIASIAVFAGWSITRITNPLGPGTIDLSLSVLGPLAFPGGVLAVMWLVFIMNAVNWFDGVDGLAPSVGTVAFTFLALVSLLPSIQDQLTLTLAIIGGAGTAAFMLWNWAPAKVYLGTSGTWFLGLFLGMVAIIGGGKIVTTLLILALPTLDLIFVIIQRLLKKQAPWQGDTVNHLHHRLRSSGLSAQSISIGATVMTIGLGFAALALQTRQKIELLTIIAIMLALSVITLWNKQNKTTI